MNITNTGATTDKVTGTETFDLTPAIPTAVAVKIIASDDDICYASTSVRGGFANGLRAWATTLPQKTSTAAAGYSAIRNCFLFRRSQFPRIQSPPKSADSFYRTAADNLAATRFIFRDDLLTFFSCRSYDPTNLSQAARRSIRIPPPNNACRRGIQELTSPA